MKKNVEQLRKNIFRVDRQNGFVLLIALVVLILLSIIGISAMQTTNLEEKMTGNARDHYLAFEAAETGLLSGENFVESLVSLTNFSAAGNNGLFLVTDPTQADPWKSIDWEAGTKPRNASENLTEVVIHPKYIVEHITTLTADEDSLNLGNYGEGTGAGAVEVFRITGFGKGGVTGSRALLQTTYGKKL